MILTQQCHSPSPGRRASSPRSWNSDKPSDLQPSVQALVLKQGSRVGRTRRTSEYHNEGNLRFKIGFPRSVRWTPARQCEIRKSLIYVFSLSGSVLAFHFRFRFFFFFFFWLSLSVSLSPSLAPICSPHESAEATQVVDRALVVAGTMSRSVYVCCSSTTDDNRDLAVGSSRWWSLFVRTLRRLTSISLFTSTLHTI